MPEKVTFSKRHTDIQQLAHYYDDVTKSLRLYFSPAAPLFSVRFDHYKPDEITKEMNERLAELEMATALSIFAAVEAAFRIDYLQRCYRKEKDGMSRAFRELHKKKGVRASLEDEIFEIWKKHTIGFSSMIGKLRAAFRFRHWLAHGRYWYQKFPTYDYLAVYSLAESVMNSLPLFGPEP
jgi:uncharacterized protein YutE (UPF0331/DUF86 family)